LGFGSIWLTGDNCYDTTVYEALGLDFNERIIGFLYVGTPTNPGASKKRLSAKDITREWNSIQLTDYAI
jgi:nitroreductase